MAQKLGAGPLDLQQGSAYGVEVLPAFVGQRQIAAGSQEQRLTQIRLQLLDLVAHCTLADRKLLGRQREAVEPGDGLEHRQSLEGR